MEETFRVKLNLSFVLELPVEYNDLGMRKSIFGHVVPWVDDIMSDVRVAQMCATPKVWPESTAVAWNEIKDRDFTDEELAVLDADYQRWSKMDKLERQGDASQI